MIRFLCVAWLLVLAAFAVAPAWAQTTNQLYMTGTGSGNAPVIYTNGVDTNINMALMPKGTGGVGIGTTSPMAKLNVVAGSGTDPLRVDDQYGIGLIVNQYGQTTINGTIVMAYDGNVSNTAYSAYNVLYLTSGYQQVSSNNIILQPSGSGMVGIDTTGPSYTLHVNGSVAGTSAYNNLSDIRLKTNIKPIDYGLDAVMKLNPIGFNWIDEDQAWKKQRQIGLVAQDVEPIIPEVVTTANDAMHTKSIAYGSLVPVLIKAMQQQQAEIITLQAANGSLQREIDALKSRSAR
jgi:Chaperone of endosialidase